MYGQRLEDIALLRHPANADVRPLIRPQPREIEAVERDLAGEITSDAHDGIDQRRFAHAVAAEQRQRLSLRERQRDARQRCV